ncbi:MAG: hypothetical protein M1827_000201 [Pycnora praestabilis]|nr:MAG: hypothetical protein M1827_000201 [Pycnora praestabilis]
MSATVVLGAQFGDEGKGKLVDVLLSTGAFQLVARCAGGHNAGHTLVIDDVKYDFHILPSGLINPKAINLIGNGCVLHVPQFFKELKALEDKGINSQDRIFISDRAHLLFELHKSIDGLEEKALGDTKIGTTGNGIGPCYSDKAARRGLRIAEMFDKEDFDIRLRRLAQGHSKRFGDLLDYDVEKEIRDFDKYRESLRDYVVDGIEMVCSTQGGGSDILVEGANALMIDLNNGTYPYVTSSDTGLAGVFSGLPGFRPESVTTRLGVVKAYTTRVGSGPFPSEAFDSVGEQLQSFGHEFGTTTGRRRRCGHLDMVLLKHSHSVNRYTHLNLTKLDVLDTFPSIKIAVAYRTKNSDGSVTLFTNRFPADLKTLDPERLEVEYKTLKGWESDITGCRSWKDLPLQAKEYVEFVERELGVPVKWVGVGPARDAMVERL